MGLTRRYETEGFSHLYLQFLYIFYAISNRCTRLRWRKSICIPNFYEISQSTSNFKWWTAAILEFYLWFRFWPMCSHRHVLLRQPAKFRLN